MVHLDIPGGEPFLSGVHEQQRLLSSLIAQGRSHEISIHYTTNGTIFPDPTWWKLWTHFREIDLQLSIDDIGQRFEYIRYHATWQDVLENVVKYQLREQTLDNFRISISCTVSAYNIAYLPEFVDWCLEQRLPRPWLGRVHAPVYMRPGVWVGDAKQYIIDRLLQHTNLDCHAWAKLLQSADDGRYFDEFVDKLHWHDRYRGVSFKDTFPEMAQYL
jgi:MoaA/NifB/PqqE/SkfB family radical SAM enzyme